MKTFSMKRSYGIIFLYLFGNILLSMLYSVLPIESKILDNIVLSLISIALLFFVITMLKDLMKGQLGDFFGNIKKYFPKILKYWILGFIFMIIANYLINFLILDGIAPNESANREILKLYPMYSLIHMCLVGPFTEELLFRLNFGAIKNKALYLIVSSVSFGLMHIISSSTKLSDILYIIPYTILGLSFGYIYYETKNVYASTLAHVLHNTLSIVIIMLGI